MLFAPLQKQIPEGVMGISGGFSFLLLLCVFAVQALALVADRPSVLPCVGHRDCHVRDGGIAESIAPCIRLPLAGMDPSEFPRNQVRNIAGWWLWLGE